MMNSTQQHQSIFDLRSYDLFIFPISWLIFVTIGRAFFENCLGQYHSTHSKKWASLCKSLFLLSFVTCCTLLELVTFEILDLLHPALRLFFWTTSLAILALLLNVLIPAVLAVSMGFHKNFSVRFSILLGLISLCLFQSVMWLTGSFLHSYQNKQHFSATSSNEAILDYGTRDLDNIDISDISSPSVLKWVFMFDRENASNTDNQSLITPLITIIDFILQFDIQQSIANIAVLGTVCAAIISGFATVFFPLEQLLIFRGVDAEQLRRREHSLSQLLREIATRKKEVLLLSHRLSASSYHLDVSGNCRAPHSRIMDNELSLFDRRSTHNIGIDKFSGSDDYNLPFLNKSVTLLEELSADLFSEIVDLKQQQHNAETAQTQWGRIMKFLGQILTLVAIARLVIGVWHVFDHLSGVTLNPSHEIASAQVAIDLTSIIGDDIMKVGAIISNRSEHIGILNYNGVKNVDTDISGFSNTGDLITDNVEADLVTTSLSFLLFHLNIDGTAWGPFLSSVFVGSMALLQVRSFLVATEQLARLGVMSTSTELYSLSLALLSGFYFMACVWQLSFQLPLRCRKGVSLALGEAAPFDLCFLLFDAVFVVSTVVFGLLLWYNYRRKVSLSCSLTSIS